LTAKALTLKWELFAFKLLFAFAITGETVECDNSDVSHDLKRVITIKTYNNFIVHSKDFVRAYI